MSVDLLAIFVLIIFSLLKAIGEVLPCMINAHKNSLLVNTRSIFVITQDKTVRLLTELYFVRFLSSPH